MWLFLCSTKLAQFGESNATAVYRRDGVIDIVALHQPDHIQFNGVGAFITDSQKTVAVGDDVGEGGRPFNLLSQAVLRAIWGNGEL